MEDEGLAWTTVGIHMEQSDGDPFITEISIRPDTRQRLKVYNMQKPLW